MATRLVRDGLSVLNTGINSMPMGPWTLNQIQDVYNKVKDTSPTVVSNSLNKVESVVQQFIDDPEKATIDVPESNATSYLESLVLPDTLSDDQVVLLNEFLSKMIKEKEAEAKFSVEKSPDWNSSKLKEEKKTENFKMDESCPNFERTTENEKSLTAQQMEWSKEMIRFITVGFFALHSGFKDILFQMEKEKQFCLKFDPEKPYYRKLMTVMTRCVMDWLSKTDFLNIMVKIFNTVSITGELLKNYFLLGRRLIYCIMGRMENFEKNFGRNFYKWE